MEGVKGRQPFAVDPPLGHQPGLARLADVLAQLRLGKARVDLLGVRGKPHGVEHVTAHHLAPGRPGQLGAHLHVEALALVLAGDERGQRLDGAVLAGQRDRAADVGEGKRHKASGRQAAAHAGDREAGHDLAPGRGECPRRRLVTVLVAQELDPFRTVEDRRVGSMSDEFPPALIPYRIDDLG